MAVIKIPYSSLTRLDSETLSIYNNYALLKMQCEPLLSKHGFITKKEVQKVADSNHESKKTLLRKLSMLSDNGFISKSQWGYRLTSQKIINNNLNLTTINKTKTGVKITTPFAKIHLPSTNDVKVIELSRLYLLIQQIYNQYQFRSNVCKSDNRRVKRPERFQLSIEKICQKGKYKNKMAVWRLINQLEKSGVLNVQRGKKNDSGYNDCNRYTMNPLSKAKWENIRNVDEPPLAEPPSQKTLRKKKVVLGKVEVKKRAIEYNHAESSFFKCLSAGLQDILVDAGYLSRTYRSFGIKKGKRITKNMISELLIYSLNDLELRKILFTVLKPDNILVSEECGYYFDSRLTTYHKDRFHFYDYNKVFLSDSGGNFREYEDLMLESKRMNNERIKSKLYHFNVVTK